MARRSVLLLLAAVALLMLGLSTTAGAASYAYDVPAFTRGHVHLVGGDDAAKTEFTAARDASASTAAEARGASTTSSRSCVATEAAGGVNIKALMGADGDVVVLGRQVDTAVAQNWPGHVVLNTPNWSLEVNDAFMSETIAQGRAAYLATPLEGNLVQTAGQYAGQPTIYARELEQLVNAGYHRVGDSMIPPGG